MTAETMFFPPMLSPQVIDDRLFFKATALLAARFDRSGEPDDLRADPVAPQILFDWLRHAAARVPDFRVWVLSSRLEMFLDPCSGLVFPGHWPWHTRDRLLAFNDELRASLAWGPAFEAAADEAGDALERWAENLYLGV